MSEVQPTEVNAPPCPMCSKETFLKQTHREHARDEHVRDLLLRVLKCSSCAVEYPVVFPAGN
jgi:hypothetical protein